MIAHFRHKDTLDVAGNLLTIADDSGFTPVALSDYDDCALGHLDLGSTQNILSVRIEFSYIAMRAHDIPDTDPIETAQDKYERSLDRTFTPDEFRLLVCNFNRRSFGVADMRADCVNAFGNYVAEPNGSPPPNQYISPEVEVALFLDATGIYEDTDVQYAPLGSLPLDDPEFPLSCSPIAACLNDGFDFGISLGTAIGAIVYDPYVACQLDIPSGAGGIMINRADWGTISTQSEPVPLHRVHMYDRGDGIIVANANMDTHIGPEWFALYEQTIGNGERTDGRFFKYAVTFTV